MTAGGPPRAYVLRPRLHVRIWSHLHGNVCESTVIGFPHSGEAERYDLSVLNGQRKQPAKSRRAISARYHVESQLAVGGMGTIYRARDVTSNRMVALKRSLALNSGWRAEKAVSALEQEYRVLVALRHPHIIEVFDYGFDETGPFYTMELLDGSDLAANCPVPWNTVCRYLRDIASSLALLHSRGLIHRDISPSNIRLTGQGRAKLIDFGAIMPFGSPLQLIGTLLGMAPEVVAEQDLDQRTDLYALGATAYYALCGRAPYPANGISQLSAAWAQGAPPLPSTWSSEIPKALDQLVLDLLSLDALARPASAAEVIERLNAVADLPPESDERVVRSYLRRPELVGRNEALDRCLDALDRVRDLKGGTLLVEALPGYGKSALLEQLERQARLQGALVLTVSCRAHRETFGACRALVERANGELGGTLTHPVFAMAASNLSSRPPPWYSNPPTPPSSEIRAMASTRVLLPAMLVDFFASLAVDAPSVIILDDAHHADIDSLAVFLTLAEEARGRGLLLVVACDPDGTTDVVALRAMARTATRVRLGPLDARAITQLVRATFGDVAASERLSAWLYDQTRGIPRLCTEQLGLLITHGQIRYADGSWHLPREFTRVAPPSMEDLLGSTLGRLSDQAKVTATHLSAERLPLDVGLCQRVLSAFGLTALDVQRSLHELVGENILLMDGEQCAFASSHMRKALYTSIPSDQRRRIHRVFAHALPKEPADALHDLRVVGHLVAAEEHVAAARLLVPAASHFTRRGEELTRAAPDLLHLREQFEVMNLPEKDWLVVSVPLLISSQYADPSLMDKYGERTIAVLERAAGMDVAAKVYRFVGSTLAFLIGLSVGFVRNLFDGSKYKPRPFVIIPLAYFGLLAAVYHIASFRIDPRPARWLAEKLAPFAKLPRTLGARLVYDIIVSLGPQYPQGIMSLAGLSDMSIAVRRARDFDADVRAQFVAALEFGMGRTRLLSLGMEALEHAERMTVSPNLHHHILAAFLRHAHHLSRGELAQAIVARDKLDRLAARDGNSWTERVNEFETADKRVY